MVCSFIIIIISIVAVPKLSDGSITGSWPSCIQVQSVSAVAGLRPSFRELLLSLLSSPKVVLSIPQEALNTHKLAGVLGSPLEVGANMYRDLQNKYYDNADYQELA